VESNVGKRRCKGRNKRGERCRAHVVNVAGYCAVHDPESTIDMRELGKASVRARARPNEKRVHPSLREYLRTEVAPERVWRAIEAALEGDSEAARILASRLLVDALHESGEEADWRVQARSERQVAAERFMAQIERAVEIKANTGDIVDAEGRVLGTITRVELERLREIERRWLALPEHVRAEFSAL
jgi:hypothetical protein